MNRAHLFLPLLVLALLALACGLPASGTPAQPGPAATVPSGGAANPTPAPLETVGPPFLSAPGAAALRLLTATQGGGDKPLFQWESVPAAARYQLYVFDEAGEPYWAWEGTQTQIYMGGTQSQPRAGSSGPFVASGFTWAVLAYSSDGKLLASSDRRAISP